MLAGVRVYAVTDISLTREAFRTIREKGMNHPPKRILPRVTISLKVVSNY